MSPNDDMTDLWNGPATSAWVEDPDRYDRMLEPFGQAVLGQIAIRPGERVLDVGCGSGALTRAAARRMDSGGSVVGVDVAVPLVELARRRTADPSVSYLVQDAQSADLGQDTYDVVVSRFGVMFFEDPTAAFANLARSTAQGGRLGFVCWQPLTSNPWALAAITALLEHVPMPSLPAPGAPGPFAFGDPDHVRTVLTDGGWSDIRIDPMTADLHVYGARTAAEAARGYSEDAFGRALLSAGDPAAQQRALDALVTALRPHETADGVRLGSAAWVVTARRGDAASR